MSTTTYSSNNVLNAVAAAAKVLDERKEEVNRLNVFPVPDGDTGTNMSLTIQSVVSNVANLPIGASGADIRKAVTTGALMGARGNSGVITSQILRGLCEGSQGFDEFDVESIAGRLRARPRGGLPGRAQAGGGHHPHGAARFRRRRQKRS